MFSIIVAISKNGIIGLNNQLIWNLPDDLKNFKNVTLNHKVVMGRKTYTSFKNPLPNRENLVVTHQTIDKQGFKRINNLDSFIEENKDTEEEIFIIGGAQIYELFFQYTKKDLHVGRIGSICMCFGFINARHYFSLFVRHNNIIF